MTQSVKNLFAMTGDLGLIPGWEGLLEEEMATHFRFSPGKFQGQRQFMRLQTVRHY